MSEGEGGAAAAAGHPGELYRISLLRVFITEITRQVQAAAMCADLLNQAVEELRQIAPSTPVSAGQLETPGVEHGLEVVFYAAQGMLTAGALVSKMLWMSQPQRRAGCACVSDPAEQEIAERAKRRCKDLRAALGVKGDIPELSSRRVRNAFEHFDSRLDSYFADGNMTYVDIVVGPPDTVVYRSGRPTKYLRRYDPDTTELHVLDDSISLQALLTALEDLAERAKQWLADNSDSSKP